MKTTKIVIHILIGCLALCFCPAKAQSTLPKIDDSLVKFSTPNVSSMFKIVDCPISYFNGTVDISIPLCNVEAEGLSLPISLTYASTGFKPSQEASWVGLGWNLSLDMSISRTVKCIDDFFESDHWAGANKFYYGYYNMPEASFKDFFTYERLDVIISDAPNMHVKASYAIPRLNRDIEPDIFYYSLFNGGGKFIFNNDTILHKHDIIMTDKQRNMKVKILDFTENNDIKHYFQLIDNDGTIYEFKKLEHEYDYSGDPSIDGKSNFGISYSTTDYKASFTSSWFLTKIKPTEKDSIEFIYEDEFYYAPTRTTCTKYNEVQFLSNGILGEFISNSNNLAQQIRYPWHKSLFKTAHLKQIKWKHGKIDFLTSAREDVFNGYGYICEKEIGHAPYKLDRIVVYNSSDEKVKDFQFCYSYFSANDNDSYLTKRLRLDGIVDNLAPRQDYSFSYHDGKFPSKESTATDYWGYYNGVTPAENFYYEGMCSLNGKYYPGVDAQSKLETTQLGQIKEIIYPTGETEKFNFELNEFMMDSYYSTGGESLGSYDLYAVNQGSFVESSKDLSASSGIRLECVGNFHYSSSTTQQYNNTDLLLEVIDKNSGKSLSESQLYSSQGEKTPSHLKIEKSFTLPKGNYKIVSHAPRSGWAGQWSVKCFNDAPIEYHVASTHRSGAGLRVESVVTGNKKREFSYSTGTLIIPPITNYNTVYSSHIEEQWSATSTIYYVQNSEPTRPLASLSNGYVVGYETVTEKTEDCTTTYDYGTIIPETCMISDNFTQTSPIFSNGLLKEKTTRDKNSKIMSQDIMQYTSKSSGNINAAAMATNGYYEHFKNYNVDWFYPSSKKSKVDSHEVLEEYHYTENLLLNQITRSDNGMSTKECVLYTTEDNSSTSEKMAGCNIILPVETSTWVNNVLASKTKMSYSQKSASYFLPSKIDIFDISKNKYVEHVSYDRYDNDGNPLQVTRDGIPSVYIWGYSNEYPVAEISNMTYQDLLKYVTSSSLTNIANAKSLSENQMTTLASLRKAIATNRLCSSMTIYTYKPLVGITSQIAPNGLTTCYEYDSSGRLIETAIKTADGKKQTLNKYQYNYKGVQK